MKKPYVPLVLAVAGLLLGATDQASAFPRTKERATLTLTFDLQAPAPTDPNAPPPANPVSGTATIDVTRTNGVEEASDLEITTTNLAPGTYDVEAILKSDAAVPPVPVLIGQITVPATGATLLPLPATVKALDIEVLNVVLPGVASTDPNVPSTTDTIVLTGTPAEDIEKWTFFGNVPVVAGEDWVPAPVFKKNGKPHNSKGKRIHGHVLIQAKIYNNVDRRRKFLLVAHNGPANTTLTIRLDGVDAGTVTTTKNGKMMVKSLEGDFRIAGVHILEIVQINADQTETVVAVADFFPGIE